MNKNILIVLFTSILVLLLTSTASAYTIEGNTVTEHFTPVSLNATPHTAHSTGWVYFGADSHTYTGDFDVCWGFNSSEALPTKAELYSPHWVNTTSNHSQTFYNVSSFTLYTGSTLDYGNTYNTNYSYTAVHEVTTYNETTMEPNGTEWITSNASFDSFVNDNGNYTITWHNRHDKWTIYKDFTGSFQTVNYNHNGFDKWYYIKNVPVVAGQAYNVRAWVEVPISLTPQTGKFYYAVKPSSETIAEAIGNNHFYALDPWWNSSWNYYKVISINQTMVNQAIGNVHYTLLVDITDTDLRDHAQADGDDIVFTDSTDSTQLDHQISSYNSTTGALVAYVNVTDISNVTSINMYYNNSGATNTEDKAGTWGTAALGVWLFDEGTGSYVNDSSGNDNNGTITGATWNASGGLDFDASGNYITTADSPEVTTFTLISTFTRNGDAGGSNSDFHQLFCGINKSINNRIMVKSDGTNSYAGVVVGGSYKNDQLTISDVNSRHTVATIWDGSYVYACLDGLKGTTPTATTGTLQSGASNIIIGRYSSSSYLTNGTIRNGFLYDYDLSSDEIATNYNNTEYPSLFISLGAEQSDSPNPLINSWQNNKTNNNSLDITINASESVNFNVTANQTITTWVWNKDTVDQIHDYNNITLSWSTGGLKHVTASATNENGTSNIITWNVTIDGGCEYYEVINSTHLEACTCNQSDVQAAIDNATDFQTVLIPAGNATWGDSASYLSVDKQITLQGNGSNTVINISNSAGSWSSGTIRISDRATVKDFTIQTNSTGNSGTVFSVNADWFRISSITYDQLTSSVNGYFLFSNKYGLVDNCNITGGSGTSELIFARGPTDSWQTLSSIGGSNNLFIEDTTFNGVGYVCDFNSNSRGVIRENDITGPMKIDAHGKCSNTPSRGVRHMEIYENTWSYNNNAVKIEFRGGTGMIFNNHREYSLGTGLQLKEYSAFQQCSSFGYVCQCPEDYPIDDQIGTGMDPKTAASEPLYIWNNTQLITNDPWNASIKDDLIPGSCAVCNYTTFAQIILNGRDYFESTTKNTSIEYESFDYPHPLASGIPGVSLLSPLTQSTTTETTVQFNVSVIDSGNLTNVTLWGNWSGGWHANETININETYNETTFTKTLTAGTYIWNAKAHDEDGNSDWANLNYTLTITENPVITLLSQYPVDLYQNTTGYFNLSYGISHSAAGLNNTSMALTYAFYDVVNANYNTSLRIPNNDRGGLCSLLQEYILRADNRNDGLNWETNITITEGNVSKWGGGDENTSRFTIVPVNSTYTKVYWNGTAQDTLWPGTWYLDRTDQTTATMTGINIDKSNHVLLQSIVPGCGIGLGGQLIDMYVDTYQGITDPVKPITIFYLNDSYDPLGSILPTDSPYAYLVTTMTATQWYVNDYTVGNSSYVNSITVNTSAISDAGITPTTKFYVYFNTEAATSKSYYMNITNSATSTNLTFGETNMLWIGDIAPYVAHPYTPNVFFVSRSNESQFKTNFYVADTNDLWGNAGVQTSNIELSDYPPSNPGICSFYYNNSVDYDMNLTYSGEYYVRVLTSNDPDGGTVTHNLTLHYSNQTYVSTINNSITGNGVACVNVTFDPSSYYTLLDEYTLHVVATDDEAITSEYWLPVNFTLFSYTPTPPVSIQNSTSALQITWNWTKGSYSNYTNVYVNGSFYENSTDNEYIFTATPHSIPEIQLREYNTSESTFSTYTNQSTTLPNNAPTLSLIPDKSTSIGVNLTNAFDLDDYFTDIDSDVPTFAVESNNDSTNLTVTIQANNSVDFAVSATWNGTAIVVFNVSDGYGSTDTDTMIVSTTGITNSDAFTFSDIINIPTQVHVDHTSIISIDITDPDGYIVSAIVKVQGVNYTMYNASGNSWQYDYTATDWSGKHYITNFYATDNSGGTNTTTSSLYVDVIPATLPSSSGISGSSRSGSSFGISNEIASNIVCSETDTISKLQIDKPVEYRTKNSDCLGIIKLTFTPSTYSASKSIIIEKTKKQSAVTTTNPAQNVYSYFNIYVGLFGYDDKTFNEAILFKVDTSYIDDNNIDPESVTLSIYSDGLWSNLPTTLQSQSSSYYTYEAVSASTYAQYAIISTDQTLINRIGFSDVPILESSLLTFVSLIALMISIFIIYSLFVDYEYLGTGLIISFIILTLAVVSTQTPFIVSPFINSVNTILSAVLYSGIGIATSYIRRLTE